MDHNEGGRGEMSGIFSSKIQQPNATHLSMLAYDYIHVIFPFMYLIVFGSILDNAKYSDLKYT